MAMSGRACATISFVAPDSRQEVMRACAYAMFEKRVNAQVDTIIHVG